MLSFLELQKGIKYSSGTMIPALLVAIVEKAIREKCFIEGGIINTVQKIENKILEEFGKTPPHPIKKSKQINLYCGKCGSWFVLSDENIHRKCGFGGCEGTLHKT